MRRGEARREKGLGSYLALQLPRRDVTGDRGTFPRHQEAPSLCLTKYLGTDTVQYIWPLGILIRYVFVPLPHMLAFALRLRFPNPGLQREKSLPRQALRLGE